MKKIFILFLMTTILSTAAGCGKKEIDSSKEWNVIEENVDVPVQDQGSFEIIEDTNEDSNSGLTNDNGMVVEDASDMDSFITEETPAQNDVIINEDPIIAEPETPELANPETELSNNENVTSGEDGSQFQNMFGN